MINQMFKKISLMSLLVMLGGAANASVPIFNVNVTGPTLAITTNIPNHSYANAGIKVNTSGYSINQSVTMLIPAQTCTMIGNGFCQFTASATTPSYVSIQGPGGTNVTVTICLNAIGQLSCQSKTFWYQNSG